MQMAVSALLRGSLGWGWRRTPREPRARQHLLTAAGAPPYLGIGVLDTVIHKHHDEDRDGHPKVPNHPPYLWASAMLRGPLPGSSRDAKSPPPAPSSCFPRASSPHTRPGKNRLFLNLRRKKAMKKVPAMRTSDSRAVLGWPRGLPCPDGPAELPFPGPSVAPAPAHVVLLPPSLSPSASELLETEQPWRGCSWKIWGEDEGLHQLNWQGFQAQLYAETGEAGMAGLPSGSLSY